MHTTKKTETTLFAAFTTFVEKLTAPPATDQLYIEYRCRQRLPDQCAACRLCEQRTKERMASSSLHGSSEKK